MSEDEQGSSGCLSEKSVNFVSGKGVAPRSIIGQTPILQSSHRPETVQTQITGNGDLSNFQVESGADGGRRAQKETRARLNKQIALAENKFEDFVTDFADVADLTFDISKLADQKQVTSLEIETKDKSRRSALTDCRYIREDYIDVCFTASFSQFAELLNALEKHRPVIFIDNFTINRSNTEDLPHEAGMSLAVFVGKPQETLKN